MCVVHYMCLCCSIDLVSICANKEIYNIVLKHLHICGIPYGLHYDDILPHFTVQVELYISILFPRFLLIRILICKKLPYNAADFIVLHHAHLNLDLTIYHAIVSNCSSFESNQCYHFRRCHFLQSYTKINGSCDVLLS